MFRFARQPIKRAALSSAWRKRNAAMAVAATGLCSGAAMTMCEPNACCSNTALKPLQDAKLKVDMEPEDSAAGRVLMKAKAEETPKNWASQLEKMLGGNASADTAEADRMGSGSALPVEIHPDVMPPNVPPPISRRYPARVVVDIKTIDRIVQITPSYKYNYWTFNNSVPGPFIRLRVGDTLELRFTNLDSSGMAHNIDMHCVVGPGGGGPCTFAEQDETRTGIFKMLHPGLFVYHCAAAPVPQHIQNGMFGLILVEPEEGLPKVDREYCVMQHELYCTESDDDTKLMEPDYEAGLAEKPTFVFFNGKEGALTNKPLMSNQGERVRLFFGNAGPNLVSSFHIIGQIFDKLYRDGDVLSPPARSVQTTCVPAGGSAIVEMNAIVPGTYTLVDHSIFRIEKGCVGFMKVKGKPRPDIYDSTEIKQTCPNCKLHD